jgi:sugar phosphate isomerase/epimerase
LELIADYAHTKGIKIAIENRDGMTELPLDPDFKDVLFKIPNLYFWYDAGHAQKKKLLNLYLKTDILEENQDRLLGFHLKDISAEGVDNLALGKGIIDWVRLSTYFNKSKILTLELGSDVISDEIIRSRDYLINLLGSNYYEYNAIAS